ncbi:MAG: thiosulfate sulfurtransferase [Rhodospirillales bacterium]|nr:thiosulfate sulfurtransferase [Rhodospirillales bacterium]
MIARIRRIHPVTLRAWLADGAELALIDAREEGEFGAAHLFWAVPCPFSQRETRARALLPRRSVRTVVTDDGRGVAEALAAWLLADGFTDVAVLDGGTRAWAAAGGEIFSGVNVPSKAFGEWVEHHYGTESVDPPELKSWIDAGRKMVVLDSRTEAEFRRMSIPTGISVPGGELVYRIGDIVADAETLVVVNCAGRTRSIMGAESLRRAGIPNKVVALRNGTMGWELAGFRCANGRTERFDPATPRSAALARARAEAFAASCGVRPASPAQIAAFAADPARSLYLLDVRDPAEFAAHHVPGSRNAPGGQLVQATDSWIAVRNGRIVLLDDDGARASMSAAWLRQMGQPDVFVAEGGIAALSDFRGAEAAVPELAAKAPGIDVLHLTRAIDAGKPTIVVDLARSLAYRDGHIPAALWGVRGRLGQLRAALAGAELVVATSPDGSVARLALAELRTLAPKAEIVALEGGTAAWHAFGRPLVKDRQTPPDAACIDAYLRPYDRNSGVEAAMHEYLSWEIDLVNAIARDGSVHFGATG